MEYPQNDGSNNRTSGEYMGNESYTGNVPPENARNSAGGNGNCRENGYNRTSPSGIYNENRNPGTTPQYHYGRPIPMMDNEYIFEQQKRNLMRTKLKKKIRRSAFAPAFALLMFLALGSSFFCIFLFFPELRLLYSTSSIVSSSIGILYSVVTVAFPLYFIALVEKVAKKPVYIPFGKPKTPGFTNVLLLFIGFGGALLANVFTNFIDSFFSGFGVSAYYPDSLEPKNTVELIFMFIGTAVIPPLTEEFAMRGVIMQSLRKYGDGFAIITSAVLFGLFHGNFVQIPFAFLCGLLLGYIACVTDSIWMSIAVHALVNGFSCLQYALNLYIGENISEYIMNILTVLMMALGVVSFFLYLLRNRDYKSTISNRICPELTIPQKIWAFFTNPVMIIAVLLLLGEAFSGLSISR